MKGLLICRRASDPCNVPGSERGHYCVKCNTEVWLSPAGQAQLRDFGVPIYCNACGFALADQMRNKESVLALINPAAMQHLHNRRSRN